MPQSPRTLLHRRSSRRHRPSRGFQLSVSLVLRSGRWTRSLVARAASSISLTCTGSLHTIRRVVPRLLRPGLPGSGPCASRSHSKELLMSNNSLRDLCLLLSTSILTLAVSAQSRQPYPNVTTDRLIYQETPMEPPARNVVFTDPDFGSSMVRATDSTTNFKLPGTFMRTAGTGEMNEWSSDTSKFYVLGKGGQNLAFAFDPTTMAISSLPNAAPGQGLLLPLRSGASFSFVDPDLIYGTSDPNTMTITSYRFSTGVSTPIIDTTTCGAQPPLVSGPKVVSDDDVSLSLNDTRVSISEGGPDSGDDMYIVVYDKTLGCRWYNTQTGQIGGQWGAIGTATVTTPYLIRHAYLSRSGSYIVIKVNNFGWYVWDLSTLNVTGCPVHDTSNECAGYMTVGYNSLVNGPALTGDMQTALRPLSNI